MKSFYALHLLCLSLVFAASNHVAAFAPIVKSNGKKVDGVVMMRLQASPNPIISTAAKGMTLLAPVFKAEASLQAQLLSGPDDLADAKNELALAKKKNKVLIYTYGLSPFSAQALALLDASGYAYTPNVLGPEWFLLDGKGSAMRQVLGGEVDNGATSLPKIFVGGQCIGGCAELSRLVADGELDALMKKARVPKRKN